MCVIQDIVYKETAIDEPILEQLIHSPTVERLKEITQAGVPDIYNSLHTYDRYQHSIGVMLLLRRLGATIEEQVAGLLHDISHLAFSHVAEWVFQESGKIQESLNETLTRTFIEESELCTLLIHSGFSIDRLVNFDNFPLLKRNIPDLNADRTDYSLREIYYWINPDIVPLILDDIRVVDQMIVFKTEAIAHRYAVEFLNLQQNYWGSYDSLMRYQIFSSVLKKMVKTNILTMDDFFQTEPYIIQQIQKQTDPEIRKLLFMLREKDLTKFKGTFGITVRKKFRYVDPKVIVKHNTLPLSSLNEEFATTLLNTKIKNNKGIRI
jgi:uncharacterized protein